METLDFKQLAQQYKDELLNSCLPFWLENSQDHEYGGYFSCLNRDGSVFDTDKFIWLQGREVWMCGLRMRQLHYPQARHRRFRYTAGLRIRMRHNILMRTSCRRICLPC